MREGRRQIPGPLRAWGLVLFSALGAGFALGQISEPMSPTAPAVLSPLEQTQLLHTVAGLSCTSPDQCSDNHACTSDLCPNGTCLNVVVPDCIECISFYNCLPVDIVFLMDTSGSMRDEAVALCTGIATVVQDLLDLGIEVHPTVLGITEAPGGNFSCLSNHVVGLLGDTVPGDAQSCPFPNTLSAYESWGPATAIVADRFPWSLPSSTRIIVPISDEGPCDGSRPEGCNDPGEDRNSIENAIAIATHPDNQVIVSPIAGTGSDACVLNLATALANGTGGIMVQSTNPKLDFSDAIISIILNRCSLDDRCDDEHACTTHDRCLEGRCVGTPIDDCRPCLTPVGCDDADGCTLDECIDGICRSTLNYNVETECCDPIDGGRTVIEDENVCTIDQCNPESGLVTHTPAPTTTPCDDGKECTVLDLCDPAGRCLGTDIGSIPCNGNEDCFGFGCDVDAGDCVCGDVPEVCLNPLRIGLEKQECFPADEDLVVTIDLSSSSRTIVGGQFLIGYDPTVLDFVDVEPGSFTDFDSPFGAELLRTINETEGTVFYAVGVNIGLLGTRGPAVMAKLRFHPLQPCRTMDDLCFLSQNPRRTMLTDSSGHQVPFSPCCPGPLKFQGDEPSLACPPSVMVNADPGSVSATVTWPPTTASSDCDGNLDLSCSGVNSFGADVTHLAMTGGRIPAGTSDFECSATDSCGQVSSCEWTVDILPTNTVQATVQLSPVVSPGPLRRCIVFEFYSSCVEEPVVVERTLEFGQPFNLPGYAENVVLEVPAGRYVCATARDPKHTLRSTVQVAQPSGNHYTVQFLGDPRFGGHWLIGGNLDDNGVIDSLDQMLLQAADQTTVNRHTPCGTPGVHADINGDGAVNASDLLFIQRNFLATDGGSCCGSAIGGIGAVSSDAAEEPPALPSTLDSGEPSPTVAEPPALSDPLAPLRGSTQRSSPGAKGPRPVPRDNP